MTFRRGVLVSIGLGAHGLNPFELSGAATHFCEAGADALFVEPADLFEQGGAEPFSALGALPGSLPLLLGGVATLSDGRQPALVAKLASSLSLLCAATVALILDVSGESEEVALEALDVVSELGEDGPRVYRGGRYRLEGAFNEPRSTEPLVRVLLTRTSRAVAPALRARADVTVLPGGGEGTVDLVSPLEARRPQGPYLADCSRLGLEDAISFMRALGR